MLIHDQCLYPLFHQGPKKWKLLTFSAFSEKRFSIMNIPLSMIWHSEFTKDRRDKYLFLSSNLPIFKIMSLYLYYIPVAAITLAQNLVAYNEHNIYFLTVLEAKSLSNSRCWQSYVPHSGSSGKSIPCCFQLLVAVVFLGFCLQYSNQQGQLFQLSH